MACKNYAKSLILQIVTVLLRKVNQPEIMADSWFSGIMRGGS